MRALLIRPSTHGYAVPPPDTPSGLLYVASALRNAGHEVAVQDFDVHEADLSVAASFDAVGLTVLSKARQNAFRLVRELRTRWPEKKIVLGGPHVSSLPQLVADELPADALVVGEGEATCIQAFEDAKDGQVCSAELLKIDDIAFPAYELVNMLDYRMQVAATFPEWRVDGKRLGSLAYAPVVASRGCHGRCAFCNSYKHWGMKLRTRSAKNVVDELEMLKGLFQVELVSFNDNCFPSTKQQGIELCEELIARDLGIVWKCDTRGDVIDCELAQAMRRAGCFMVAVGLESGSPRILENINKRLDLAQARESLLAIKEAGLLCYVLLMAGNPGEDDSTIRETTDFVNAIKPHLVSWVRGVMVLPGTALCETAGVADEYWAREDGLPYYLEENTMEDLERFSVAFERIEKERIPADLVLG